MPTSFKVFTLCVWLLAMILAAGCGKTDRVISSEGFSYPTICINGVQYVIVERGVSVMFNADGTVKTCK